ncbi:hypothetical protein Tco_0882146 [Tanacetum coccineum]
MVSKVNESLGVLEYHHDSDGEVCGVWVMDDDGVTKSLTKMFTVKVPGKLLYSNVLALRQNGEVMIEMLEDSGEEYGIEVYEPSSGRINGMGLMESMARSRRGRTGNHYFCLIIQVLSFMVMVTEGLVIKIF